MGELSRVIYKGTSQAAHHQRAVVDEGIDHERRTMVSGPDSSDARRLDFTVFAGPLIKES